MSEETDTEKKETKCPGRPHSRHLDLSLNCYLDGSPDHFTRHMKPYPLLTDWVRSGQEMCPDRIAAVTKTGRIVVWRCTRELEHPGKHEAGGMGQMKLAEWGTSE